MEFAYRARDPLGNILQGQVEASTEDEARQTLRRDGYAVLEIDSASSAVNIQLLPKRVRKSDIIYTTTQLGMMIDTGITLSTALDGVSSQETNPTWRRVLEDLKGTVESGEDLSRGMARHPKYFDRTYVSLVQSSESTGNLGEMLERIATYLRKELETRSKVRSSMIYPGLMFCMAVAVTIFLLTWVFPQFMPLFEYRNVKLPLPTKIMLAISRSLTGYWYLYIAGVLAVVIGLIWGRRTEQGARAWDWFKINAPVIGPLTRKVVLSRSIRTFGTMLAGGVSMLEAIDLCGKVSGNYYYQKLWEEVSEAVVAGNQIWDALCGNELVPGTLVQMIRSGEETGKLDEVLERVSDYYDREVEVALKTATSLIEPIMVILMGILIGGIAMSLLLPIFSLSSSGM